MNNYNEINELSTELFKGFQSDLISNLDHILANNSLIVSRRLLNQLEQEYNYVLSLINIKPRSNKFIKEKVDKHIYPVARKIFDDIEYNLDTVIENSVKELNTSMNNNFNFEGFIPLSAAKIKKKIMNQEVYGSNTKERIKKHGTDFSDELEGVLKMFNSKVEELTDVENIKELEFELDVSVKNFNTVVGKYVTRYNILMETEAVRAYNTSNAMLYEEQDFNYVQLNVIVDDRTSTICLGKVDKIISVKDLLANPHLGPPFHPNCRTTIAPFYEVYDDNSFNTLYNFTNKYVK